MRKLRLIFLILFMLSLTGCIKKYELSERQSDATAEFMAGLLLKYDNEYEAKLAPKDILNREDNISTEVDEENRSEEPTPIPAQDDTVGSGGVESEESAKEYTLTEVIGASDIEIEYSGYQICENYPEDSSNTYFSLTALEGNQLLVTSFLVKNLSEKDKTLNLKDYDVLYRLDINVGTVYKPLLTLLENDLQYINIPIEAGKDETVLLIFEIAKDIDISEINLIASKDDRTEIIEIK